MDKSEDKAKHMIKDNEGEVADFAKEVCVSAVMRLAARLGKSGDAAFSPSDSYILLRGMAVATGTLAASDLSLFPPSARNKARDQLLKAIMSDVEAMLNIGLDEVKAP